MVGLSRRTAPLTRFNNARSLPVRNRRVDVVSQMTKWARPVGSIHSSLQPNAITYISPVSQEAVAQVNIDQLTSGRRVLWVYGTINYDDTFGFHHWTTFATTFNPIKNTWENPPVHNDVDVDYFTGTRC